jgi:gluconolactonase
MLRPLGQGPDYSGGRIEVIDPGTGAVTRLYDRCGEHPLKGPNDIVFDPRRGFWFTDLGKVRRRDRDHGGVYWAEADGSRIVEVAFPIFGGANGIGLSPDGGVLYVAETETGRLWAWDVEEPGRLRKEPWPSTNGGRVLCQFPGYRRLDSLAVTAAGNICVATLVSGEITTVSPGGRSCASCPCPSGCRPTSASGASDADGLRHPLDHGAARGDARGTSRGCGCPSAEGPARSAALPSYYLTVGGCSGAGRLRTKGAFRALA